LKAQVDIVIQERGDNTTALSLVFKDGGSSCCLKHLTVDFLVMLSSVFAFLFLEYVFFYFMVLFYCQVLCEMMLCSGTDGPFSCSWCSCPLGGPLYIDL